MLRRIHTKTDGDWRLIEDDHDRMYRFTGPRRAALKHEFDADLAEIDLDGSLVDQDPKGRLTDPGTSMIHNVTRGGSGSGYIAEAENGDRIELSASELKTLLFAKQPPHPIE